MKISLIVICLSIVFGLCHGRDNQEHHDNNRPDTESIDIVPEHTAFEGSQEAPVMHLQVRDSDKNITCILAQLSAKVEFKISENFTQTFIINGTTGEGSHCGNHTQKLVIESGKMAIAFNFEKSNDSVSLKTASFFYNSQTYNSNATSSLFQVSSSNSYKCDSGLTVELYNHGNTPATLVMKSMRFDAFREKDNDEFDTDSVCCADVKSNKTIPMIIAFVLAGMIVIILVGYIILRRREDRSAYQSV